MELNRIKIIGIAAVFMSLLSACSPQSKKLVVADDATSKNITAGETEKYDAAQKNARVAEINQKIAAAVEKARREGRTNVSVYLDEQSGIVQPGDLVEISYKLSLENGVQVSSEKDKVKILTAGPGAVLARETIGMKVKQKKRSVIEPKDAFGIRKEENTQVFPANRTMPVDMQVSAEVYKKQFNGLPSENDLIQITPYFKSKVLKVDGQKIIIRNLAEDGFVQNKSIGQTTISVKDAVITISLEAKKGASFATGEKTGRIIEADEKSFLVDFNHPYAGKKMILDLEVLSITKASEFADIELEWIEDHDQGCDIAYKEKKNTVIMLYADWCGWCKKMLSETFEDPRIKMLADQFVWIKANSDADQSLKEFYGQDGFPLIVLSDYQGKILKKMEGFKSADKLLPELEMILNTDVAKADTRADTNVGTK